MVLNLTYNHTPSPINRPVSTKKGDLPSRTSIGTSSAPKRIRIRLDCSSLRSPFLSVSSKEGGWGYDRTYVDSLFERWVLRMFLCKIDYIRVS